MLKSFDVPLGFYEGIILYDYCMTLCVPFVENSTLVLVRYATAAMYIA